MTDERLDCPKRGKSYQERKCKICKKFIDRKCFLGKFYTQDILLKAKELWQDKKSFIICERCDDMLRSFFIESDITNDSDFFDRHRFLWNIKSNKHNRYAHLYARRQIWYLFDLGFISQLDHSEAINIHTLFDMKDKEKSF